MDPQTNETIIVGTAMRNNPYYATYYVVWSKLILTDLVPYFIIILANSFIVVKIVKSSRFRARIVRNRNKTTVLNREVSLKIMYKMIIKYTSYLVPKYFGASQIRYQSGNRDWALHHEIAH